MNRLSMNGTHCVGSYGVFKMEALITESKPELFGSLFSRRLGTA